MVDRPREVQGGLAKEHSFAEQMAQSRESICVLGAEGLELTDLGTGEATFHGDPARYPIAHDRGPTVMCKALANAVPPICEAARGSSGDSRVLDYNLSPVNSPYPERAETPA